MFFLVPKSNGGNAMDDELFAWLRLLNKSWFIDLQLHSCRGREKAGARNLRSHAGTTEGQVM